MNWTPKDAARARAEGWKLVHGNLAITYNEFDGSHIFNSVYEVLRHLREQGRTSDWHKEVYLSGSSTWSIVDHEMAGEEGWTIDAYRNIVRRHVGRFPDNEAALTHVIKQAESGDPLHIKALALVSKHKLLNGAF